MSGTSGMLSALANFNGTNLGTFYPDLYKLKLQILNTNKKGLTDATYTYTPRAAAANVATQISEYKSILAELKRLFPDYSLYCTKTSIISSSSAPLTSATASNAYFLYTTGTQPSLSANTVKDYIWYIYIPCLSGTLGTANSGAWIT